MISTAIDILNAMIEKCGGPGSGVPGPCPGPKKPKSPKARPAKQKTEASELTPVERSSLVTDFSKEKKELVRSDMEGALWSYTGDGYREINASLRKGKKPAYDVPHLDMALAKYGKRLKKDVYLYRGVSKRSDLKPGDEFEDKGFVSTSASRDSAEVFADRSGTLYRIRAKKGTRVLVPRQEAEQEVILGRGSRFRVVSVQEEGGVQVMDIEHIGTAK